MKAGGADKTNRFRASYSATGCLQPFVAYATKGCNPSTLDFGFAFCFPVFISRFLGAPKSDEGWSL
jgi:hypothetical protein